MGNLSPRQLGLLENRFIDLQGEINDDAFEYVRECIMALFLQGNPPITIIITSGGGGVAVGLMIYDLLRLYPGAKTGIVAGYVRSISTIILQACDKRVSQKHSLIFLHHVRRSDISLDQIENGQQLEDIKCLMQIKQEQLYLILAEKTKRSREEIAVICKKEEDMSAEQALAFGLIDEII